MVIGHLQTIMAQTKLVRDSTSLFYSELLSKHENSHHIQSNDQYFTDLLDENDECCLIIIQKHCIP
jgi:hypothetical protein